MKGKFHTPGQIIKKFGEADTILEKVLDKPCPIHSMVSSMGIPCFDRVQFKMADFQKRAS